MTTCARSLRRGRFGVVPVELTEDGDCVCPFEPTCPDPEVLAAQREGLRALGRAVWGERDPEPEAEIIPWPTG